MNNEIKQLTDWCRHWCKQSKEGRSDWPYRTIRLQDCAEMIRDFVIELQTNYDIDLGINNVNRSSSK